MNWMTHVDMPTRPTLKKQTPIWRNRPHCFSCSQQPYKGYAWFFAMGHLQPVALQGFALTASKLLKSFEVFQTGIATASLWASRWRLEGYASAVITISGIAIRCFPSLYRVFDTTARTCPTKTQPELPSLLMWVWSKWYIACSLEPQIPANKLRVPQRRKTVLLYNVRTVKKLSGIEHSAAQNCTGVRDGAAARQWTLALTFTRASR